MKNHKQPRLLIVEDESGTRDVLARFLKNDYAVTTAPDGDAGIQCLRSEPFDAVLTDLRMNGSDGFAVLAEAKKSDVPCIVLTAYGSIETAVEAMRQGAFDFVAKPVSFDRLELLLQRLFQQRELQSENRELKRQLSKVTPVNSSIIGSSKAVHDMLELVRQVAPTRASVLITGESGTGKELVAEQLHRESGRSGPFVALHCAALPETLLESELFGHEKGAFTGAVDRRAGRFETAAGGTLFLDEIGEISQTVQVKLLRVLESRTFERVGGSEPLKTDARIVAATNRDLVQMIREGTFREDLYFRLDVVRIHLPPLRERVEDIPLLAKSFLDRFALENDRPKLHLTSEALEKLCLYSWPGNIRELRNCMERVVILTRGDEITSEQLPVQIRFPQTQKPDAFSSAFSVSNVSAPLLDIQNNERQLILQALEKSGGNRTLAAEILGISRRTLHRKLKGMAL